MTPLLQEMLSKIETHCQQIEQRASNSWNKYVLPSSAKLQSLDHESARNMFYEAVRDVVEIAYSGIVHIRSSSIRDAQNPFEILRDTFGSELRPFRNALHGTEGGLKTMLSQVFEYQLIFLLKSTTSMYIGEYWGKRGKLSSDVLQQAAYIREYQNKYSAYLPFEFKREVDASIIAALHAVKFFENHYFMIKRMRGIF